MSVVDIIIIIVLIWAALCALKNVVRAVLIVLVFALLLSLGCALWAHFVPDSLEGGSRLYTFFAHLGLYIIGRFLTA